MKRKDLTFAVRDSQSNLGILFLCPFVGSYFCPQPKGMQLQAKTKKKLHVVEVVFPNGTTKTVKVKSADLESAEKRALKFNPSATGVKR